MLISKEIFRAYDIRGIVDVNLTETTVELIGQAVGTMLLELGENKILVGRDGRISGPKLMRALVQGLLKTGCDVVQLGQIPTPIMYFATNTLGINSGIIITGSHNPKDYNGLKIVLQGKALYGQDIENIYSIIQKGKVACGLGNLSNVSITDDYIQKISQDFSINKRFKVVIDCGNGVAGNIAPDLYRACNVEVIPLFCEIDGNFPNHHPDPGDPNNLKDLINAVITHKADLGLAFDGDADRLGVVDSNGKIIWPDRYAMLLVEELLSRKPDSNILFDIKSSAALREFIAAKGGNHIIWKTGHSLIKAKMLEENAELAIEMSGHIFFKDQWFGVDDGLLAGIRLLHCLSKYDDCSNIFATYPEYVATPEIVIPVTDATKFTIIDSLVKNANFANAKNIITIDGLRVEFTNGWGLIRASNTTPNLIARFEGITKQDLEDIKQDFFEFIKNIVPDIILPKNT